MQDPLRTRWAKAHWSGGINLAVNMGQRWSATSIRLLSCLSMGEGRSYSGVNLQSSLTPGLTVESIWAIPWEFQLLCVEMLDAFVSKPSSEKIFNSTMKQQSSYYKCLTWNNNTLMQFYSLSGKKRVSDCCYKKSWPFFLFLLQTSEVVLLTGP